MSNIKEGKGSCLCGKVTIEAKTLNTDLGVCHCDMCRKWSAGPYFAVDCGVDVTISGEEYISTYDSSEWAERGFCKSCGTSLFYRLKETNQHMMSAQLFEEPSLNFNHQIFIEEKPSYYEFSNKTHDMTGAEVFAAAANKS